MIAKWTQFLGFLICLKFQEGIVSASIKIYTE